MDFDSPGPTSIPTSPAGDGSYGDYPSDTAEGDPCQLCGQGPARVVGFMYVMSFLLFTRHAEYEASLCRACATRQALKEQGKSAFLGWWGFPWGLMTFKALWVNGRTLLSWSTLNRPLAAALSLAGLVVPAGALALALAADTGGATDGSDNRVSDAVLAKVEKGHRLSDEGRYEEALAAYEEARAEAPRSSVIQYSIAQSHYNLGDARSALPFVAEAERLEPEDPTYPAFHGWLLHELGRKEAAARRVALIRNLDPVDVFSAVWMFDLLEVHDETDAALRVAESGLAKSPQEPGLLARRLVALTRLERLEEAREEVERLSQQPGSPYSDYALLLHRMRTEPEPALDQVLGAGADAYPPHLMTRFAEATAAAGATENARQRIETHLAGVEVPGDAWSSYRPWFDDASLVAALDRYLAGRTEAVPGLMRLALYDPSTEGETLRELADRVRHLDHPVAPWIDAFYYTRGFPGRSHRELHEELARHVAEAPEHHLCGVLLAHRLAHHDPVGTRDLLAGLRGPAELDPALAAELVLIEAEVDLAEDEPARALDRIRGLDRDAAAPFASPDQVDLLVAEASLLARDPVELKRRLQRLLKAEDPDLVATGLLLHWSAEYAAGAPITYQEDVKPFLEAQGPALVSAESSAARGILLAEGLVDRAEAEALLAEEVRSTLDLVALYKRAGAGEAVDPEELTAIAESPHRHELAPRLARNAAARTSVPPRS